MPSRILLVNPDEPRAERLEPAVASLRRGGVVALPTETYYGLAADPLDAAAVRRLLALKGKPDGSPVLLLLGDADQVALVARDCPPVFGLLSGMYWPGPLTLVVPARPELPPEITGGTGTVGVRVSGSALPRALAAALGRPITGTSANVRGQPPCRRALEVARAFPAGLDVILDGGPAPGGAPSTVLDLCGAVPRIVREGAIPRSALQAFLPELAGRAV